MAGTYFGGGGSTPKPRKYLFVDGAYLQKSLRSFSRKANLPDVLELDFQKISRGYDRAIYYDALPAIREGKECGEAEKIFEKEYAEKREFLNKIRMTTGFHVRDGFTRVRPQKGQILEQKGVDTWIAIDALQYAFRGVIDVAEIVTGDLDLYPLFEALLQTNTRGVLHYEPGHASEELIMAADEAVPINILSILAWSDDRTNNLHGAAGYVLSEAPIIAEFPTRAYGVCIVSGDLDQRIVQAEFPKTGNKISARNGFILLERIRLHCKEPELTDDLIPKNWIYLPVV